MDTLSRTMQSVEPASWDPYPLLFSCIAALGTGVSNVIFIYYNNLLQFIKQDIAVCILCLVACDASTVMM